MSQFIARYSMATSVWARCSVWPPVWIVWYLCLCPSENTDLAQYREATWVPNSQSRASWSRRTTPASTPRVTPFATPLATPKHSPPRETGSHFPANFVQRNQVAPPPGFSPSSSPSKGYAGNQPLSRLPPGLPGSPLYGSQSPSGSHSPFTPGWAQGESTHSYTM